MGPLSPFPINNEGFRKKSVWRLRSASRSHSLLGEPASPSLPHTDSPQTAAESRSHALATRALLLAASSPRARCPHRALPTARQSRCTRAAAPPEPLSPTSAAPRKLPAANTHVRGCFPVRLLPRHAQDLTCPAREHRGATASLVASSASPARPAQHSTLTSTPAASPAITASRRAFINNSPRPSRPRLHISPQRISWTPHLSLPRLPTHTASSSQDIDTSQCPSRPSCAWALLSWSRRPPRAPCGSKRNGLCGCVQALWIRPRTTALRKVRRGLASRSLSMRCWFSP